MPTDVVSLRWSRIGSNRTFHQFHPKGEEPWFLRPVAGTHSGSQPRQVRVPRLDDHPAHQSADAHMAENISNSVFDQIYEVQAHLVFVGKSICVES
jgi:hypothetical protein